MENTEIIKFKKLLAYFVSHLEWVNSKNDNSRGYVDYIKPFVDNKTFRVTGQGYNGDKIQNQIEQWSDFEHGKICITVQANFGNYKTSKCYLNWKGTGLNIVSTWDNDSIISLYQEEYQNQDGKRSRMRLCEAMSVESLGLFDETEISPNLVSFFEDFDNQIVKFIQHNRNIVEAKEVESSIEPISYSKQIILYGPPGTGKTYKTIDRALAIIECKSDKSSSPQDRKVRYQHYVDRGQILFTTFHQSMSYEDFVEGIKPKFDESEDGAKQLVYEVESGLFKIACAHAAYNSYLELQNKSPNKRNYTFDDLYTSFIDYVQDCLDNDIKPTYKSLSGRETSIIKINGNGSIHAHAKNSSGIKSPAPLTKDNLQKLYDRYKDTSEIKSLSQVREVVGVIPRTTEFYAVFGGLKQYEREHLKELAETAAEINFSEEIFDSAALVSKFNSGVFHQAMFDQTIEGKPVVLIIDEINRGNVSAIFGELITLIEETKRSGSNEALEVILPYSKQKFSVPSNLYIIGTMNTADRSVEALDTALRRRFAFEEMMPQPALIREDGALKATNGVLSIKEGGEIDLVKVLEIINKRIVALLDKDHQIGHSYLINVQSVQDLVHAFNNCIIPLLKEYFYHDEEKIALVLGTGFFTMENETMEEELFPAISKFRIPQSKPRLRIHTLAEDNILEALNQLIG